MTYSPIKINIAMSSLASPPPIKFISHNRITIEHEKRVIKSDGNDVQGSFSKRASAIAGTVSQFGIFLYFKSVMQAMKDIRRERRMLNSIPLTKRLLRLPRAGSGGGEAWRDELFR